jgi:hypothetical protein
MTNEPTNLATLVADDVSNHLYFPSHSGGYKTP